ncbi:MAG: beta-N-acetylhexosaminidase, partial [Alloprevotella sp.]|nr:beta-N-acetylhexosaminidase [Alloprevotella sp.]
MNKTLLASLFAGALCVMSPALAQNARPFVVPELTSWQGGKGNFVPSGRIIVQDRAFTAAARSFLQDYSTLLGKNLTIVSGKPEKGDFVFAKAGFAPASKTDTLGTEGYHLNIAD